MQITIHMSVSYVQYRHSYADTKDYANVINKDLECFCLCFLIFGLAPLSFEDSDERYKKKCM